LTGHLAKVALAGGGLEEHDKNSPEAIHLKSHSRLQKVSPTRWERLLPDL
jgi:hypothetical protein